MTRQLWLETAWRDNAGQPPGYAFQVIQPEELAAEPDLRNYLRILRRRKRIVVLVTVLFVAGGLAYSLAQHDRYTGTAEVLLEVPGAPNALNAGSGQGALTPTDVLTEIQIITSAPVKAAVSRKLGGAAPSVSVTEVGQTNVVDISATALAPIRAAAIANDYARAYINYTQTQVVDSLLATANQIQIRVNSLASQVASLEATGSRPASPQVQALLTQEASFNAQLSQLQVNTALANGGAQLVTPAVPPSSPSSPRPERNALLALVLGLVLGIVLAFLLEHLDDSVRNEDDLRRVVPDLPVLVVVPAVVEWKDHRSTLLVTMTSPKSPASEAYRSLRTSLQFITLDRPIRCLQVTSPAAGEGKTTSLANLGVMMAQGGDRVVLIDGDLRRPRLHRFFGLENQIGFTSVLLGEVTLDEALQPVPDVLNLTVIASGIIPPNPSELLIGSRTSKLLEELRSRFDTVLIDSPPVLPVTDAVLLSGQVEATLVVIQAAQTSRHSITRALDSLGQVRAPVVGLVLNGETAQGGYGYSFRYSYYGGSTYGGPTNGAGTKTSAESHPRSSRLG